MTRLIAGRATRTWSRSRSTPTAGTATAPARSWRPITIRSALQADLLSLTWPAPWGACAADGAYPAAADIRAVISYALERGWQLDRQGGTFVLSEREHAARFSVPGFLLTDRLRVPEGADPTVRVIDAYETDAP